MAIQRAQVFTTSDGKDFKDEVEALAHEKGLTEGKSIEAYVAKMGLVKAGAGMARKHVAGYLSFMDSYNPDDYPDVVAVPAEAPPSEDTQIPNE